MSKTPKEYAHFFVIFTQQGKEMLKDICPNFDRDMEDVETVDYKTVSVEEMDKMGLEPHEYVMAMANPNEAGPYANKAAQMKVECIPVNHIPHLLSGWRGCTPL